jgi:hypothetical protein
MPQHDLVIDNASGAAVRADLNNALAALGSAMKGPNAPPAPVAGMMWVDDDTPSATVWTLKQYDGADWLEIGRLDVTNNIFIPSEGVIAWADVASAASVDLGAQASRSLRITGTTTITSFGTAANGITRKLRFAGALTLTHNAGSLILPGAANIITAAGDTAEAISLGLGNWLVFNFTRASAGYAGNILLANPVAAANIGINRGTELPTTSGTAIDFTGIPAGVRRITVMLRQVSTSGAAALALRLGTSGGIVSSGYDSSWSYDAPGIGGASFGSTSHFGVYNGGAIDITSGIITLANQSGNWWLCSFAGILAASAARYRSYSAGFIDLGAALTQLRLTTDTGTPTFDQGAVNIMWEF